MTQDELLDQLLENSQNIDELIQAKKNETTFAKLEQRLKEQEQEKKIDKEVTRIIDQWNL